MSDSRYPHLGILGWRVVRLIEAHSDQLARSLMARIETSEHCRHFLEKVPQEELKERTYEIYRNLGEWLMKKTEHDVECLYLTIGERRASQGLTLSELLSAIMASKEHLWQYVDKEVLADRPFELFQEIELFTLVEQFFDRAGYFAAIGYERYHAAKSKAAVAT